MPHGGPRPNAGRKPGSKAKLQKEIAAAMPPLDSLIGTGPTPLEFMLDVMRDDRADPEMRLEAAKGAAPYCHKRQPQAVEVEGSMRVEAVDFVILGGSHDGGD